MDDTRAVFPRRMASRRPHFSCSTDFSLSFPAQVEPTSSNLNGTQSCRRVRLQWCPFRKDIQEIHLEGNRSSKIKELMHGRHGQAMCPTPWQVLSHATEGVMKILQVQTDPSCSTFDFHRKAFRKRCRFAGPKLKRSKWLLALRQPKDLLVRLQEGLTNVT